MSHEIVVYNELGSPITQEDVEGVTNAVAGTSVPERTRSSWSTGPVMMREVVFQLGDEYTDGKIATRTSVMPSAGEAPSPGRQRHSTGRTSSANGARHRSGSTN